MHQVGYWLNRRFAPEKYGLAAKAVKKIKLKLHSSTASNTQNPPRFFSSGLVACARMRQKPKPQSQRHQRTEGRSLNSTRQYLAARAIAALTVIASTAVGVIHAQSQCWDTSRAPKRRTELRRPRRLRQHHASGVQRYCRQRAGELGQRSGGRPHLHPRRQSVRSRLQRARLRAGRPRVAAAHCQQGATERCLWRSAYGQCGRDGRGASHLKSRHHSGAFHRQHDRHLHGERREQQHRHRRHGGHLHHHRFSARQPELSRRLCSPDLQNQHWQLNAHRRRRFDRKGGWHRQRQRHIKLSAIARHAD
jgi:hypothetical protein